MSGIEETTPDGGLHPWAEHVDTVLRWRRFVVSVVALAWAVILGAVLVVPRTYLAEATLALPNVAFAEARRPESETRETQPERVVKPGISIGAYKKVEAALADEAILTRALKDSLESRDIERLRRGLRQVVAPVTTGPRDDLVRADREDTVTAVRLTFSARSSRTVLEVLNTLADLIREALATRVSRDKIEAEILRSTSTAAAALTRKLNLSSKNESIEGLARDLAGLAARAPSSGAGGREIVDLASDGHRYLPAGVQLLGARAWKADNDFEIRQAAWSFKVESLKVAFYRRLDRRLRGANAEEDVLVTSDVPTIINDELRKFLQEQTGPESDFLKAEVEALRDVVEAHRAATVFVQRPSLRPIGRGLIALVAMGAAVIAALLAALVGESWNHQHADVTRHRSTSPSEGSST
jgi:hypothetical protein